MKFYIDITLIPNEEDNLGVVWSMLYIQMHLALVEIKDENNTVDIGFSFPFYNNHAFPLGDTLRVFAKSKERFKDLDIAKWLNKLDGYIYIGEIKEVPTNINGFVSFGRKQFKVNAERLARRQAKRKGISFEEALKNYENFDEEKKKKDNKLPYINVKSLSSDREMKIFIQKSIKEESKKGLFSTYGLSNEATVPLF